MKTVKFLSTLIAMAMLGFSCGGDDGPAKDDPDPEPGKPGTLTLSVSPLLITSDGKDAAVFEVLSDGKAVTDGVEIYDAITNKPIKVNSLRFTTTTPGKYKFWATYKTAISNIVEIEALSQTIPEAPADPNPASTDFKRRVLLTQFTGTGCPNCPFMVLGLRSVLAESPYDTNAVLAAAHLYNSNDPAYLSTARLDQAMGVGSYPTVVFDMDKSNKAGAYANTATTAKALKQGIAKTLEREAVGGIAVNSSLSGNTLVIRATVKSGQTGDFRVGAWLLEDGIYGKQSNGGAPVTTPGEFDTHDDCIRIADSKVSSADYTGSSLGKIEKGAIGEKVFTMTLDNKWVKENCHLVVFITVDGKVNNVVKANIGEKVAFDYN